MKKNPEIDSLISAGKPSIITIDPNIKTEITRRRIETLSKEITAHISSKKKVHIIMVKE
jgi:hypothetical protein